MGNKMLEARHSLLAAINVISMDYEHTYRHVGKTIDINPNRQGLGVKLNGANSWDIDSTTTEF